MHQKNDARPQPNAVLPTGKPGLVEAAIALADILAEENAALSVMDVPKAVGLLAAKRNATDRLIAAQRTWALPATAEAVVAAERLRILATDNRRLLERAMVAQKRLLACIARAVPAAAARNRNYAASGASTQATRPPPVALSARA